MLAELRNWLQIKSINQQIIIDTVKNLTTHIDVSGKNKKLEMQQVKADVHHDVDSLRIEVKTANQNFDQKVNRIDNTLVQMMMMMIKQGFVNNQSTNRPINSSPSPGPTSTPASNPNYGSDLPIVNTSRKRILAAQRRDMYFKKRIGDQPITAFS
jgi:hypothetical protein